MLKLHLSCGHLMKRSMNRQKTNQKKTSYFKVGNISVYYMVTHPYGNIAKKLS